MMPVVAEHSLVCSAAGSRKIHYRRGRGEHPGSSVSRTGRSLFVCSDNGPEFVARAVKRWLEAPGVGTLYIEPGSP